MKSESHDKKTILAVDDKLENLKVLITYLKEMGFELMVAQSGEEALRNVEQIIPNLILLDVQMPGLDGFETCRLLKENSITKDIPVIFMTAMTETVDKVRGFEVGAVDYLTKPLQHEEVLARINTHLTMREIQKQLEEQNILLQKKNVQLIEVNATKDKFLSIIAHDLKNPFNALLTYSSTLAENFEKLDSDNIKKGLFTLNSSANRAYNLLVDLLSWTYSHSGKMEFNKERINIGIIAKENIDLLLNRAKEKGISLSSEITEGLIVSSDKNMIATVIRNLLTNAIKFTSRGGSVKICNVVEEDNLKITVSDTGIGISEKNIKKLFRLDTYFRKTGSDNEKGTGLGLILCKELVEKMNGKIWVESEFGKGSHFIFTIPGQGK